MENKIEELEAMIAVLAKELKELKMPNNRFSNYEKLINELKEKAKLFFQKP